ncbi:MAG TPA: hypothetical protein VES88_07250 [Gemmatimonadaceae bacterium]|nr:hypothetical protein [Gemmatimonadaceae bacterium]
MVEKKKKTRPTRGATRALKAAQLAEVLPQKTLSPTALVSAQLMQDSVTTDAAELSDSTTEPTPAAVLKQEIRTLRKQLAAKTATYRSLVGQSLRGESKTVVQVLALLAESDGATKSRLITETGAKKGYIDALLSRILPSRGYVISSIAVDGTRSKAYRLSSEQVSPKQ